MLINQNQAAIKAETTRQNINRISKLMPRPAYFVDVRDGVMIDDQHPEFKYFCDRSTKKPDKNDNSKDMMRLITAVETVITEKYDVETANEIKQLIILELKDE
jgi:hypothetical protein